MIKALRIIFVILTTLFLVASCKDNLNQSPKKVFDINYGKEYDTISTEKLYGFEKELTDISLFVKEAKDTITGIVFKANSNIILNVMWDIKFNSNDINDIKYYLQQHDIFSSSICFYDENNKSNGGYFSAIRHIDNSVFQCEIRKDTSKSILTVIYHKPLTGKDLSTSIKQHEIREAEQKEYNELNKR